VFEFWRVGLLDARQAQRLVECWPETERLGADPYFGTVLEHTRAYLGLPCREGPEMRRSN
jgi:hypothetical protein